jgi:hypothetical protein
MPQTAKSRRLQNARARYDRKRLTFDEKCAILNILFNLVPVSLFTRRWISRRLEEMSEDYTRTEHRVEITRLEERNQVAAQKLIARRANRAADRAAGKLSREDAKKLRQKITKEAKKIARGLRNDPPVVPVPARPDPSELWSDPSVPVAPAAPATPAAPAPTPTPATPTLPDPSGLWE